jgi:hypothetical protein
MIADIETRPFASPATPDSRLERMLRDPLIRLVMASDGVADADIRRLAGQLAARRSVPASANACAGCA